MDWFLYDGYLRHDRINLDQKCTPLDTCDEKILSEKNKENLLIRKGKK